MHCTLVLSISTFGNCWASILFVVIVDYFFEHLFFSRVVAPCILGLVDRWCIYFIFLYWSDRITNGCFNILIITTFISIKEAWVKPLITWSKNCIERPTLPRYIHKGVYTNKMFLLQEKKRCSIAGIKPKHCRGRSHALPSSPNQTWLF